MRVSRIQFDESESTEGIVHRIACAFDPGNVLKIRGKFFKMSRDRIMNQTIAANVVADKYTLILNPGEPIPENLKESTPPPPMVVAQEPIEDLIEPEPLTEPIPKFKPEPVPEPELELKPESIPPEAPASVPPPPSSEVYLSSPPPLPEPSIDGKPLNQAPANEGPSSQSGEYSIDKKALVSTVRSSPTVSVEVGQVWQSKDTRRQSAPFTVTNIDHEFVYQANGRKIALTRMFRYRRVS